LPANCLTLEITESTAMHDVSASQVILEQLAEMGVGIAIDDFGTGYSSLAYLQRFPFDTLKIDRLFVRPNGSGRRPVILRSIIAMAQDLGMEAVAEGIETLSDGIELYQMGCTYAQGYVYGE
ncbi:EAL domain-containing protein, partial [Klebsiella pneumoniae]